MKNSYLNINLHLFDGESGVTTGAIAVEPQKAETGENNQAAADTAEKTVIYGKPPEEIDPDNHLASGEKEKSEKEHEKTPEERKEYFENLIKGEYKDQFDSRVQNILSRRFADVKSLEESAKSSNDILGLLGMKYGVDGSDTKALKEAIENDSTYWEEAAEKENLTVEQYKKLKKMESENESLKRAKQEAERNLQKDQVFAKWTNESEQLKNFYPSFDLQNEMLNDQFLKLLGAGIDMKTTYETIHHDEILTGAMSYTAQQVAKKQVDAIKSGQLRPAENGLSSRAAVTIKRDPNKLTHEDMREIKRRVMAGESITF